MHIQNIIDEIQEVVNSCSVTTNGVIISVSNPDSFLFSWRLDNQENIGSSYYSKINNVQEAEEVIKYYYSGDENIINNLRKQNNFSENDELFLHLFLKVKA